MKRIFFTLLFFSLFIVSCDPKINERAERYSVQTCPVCDISGKCRTCNGSGKCSFCGATGKRISSTKNYTGEGINLVDYEEDCPFCKTSGICSHCKGEKICSFCDGTHKVSSNWSFFL
ncbi:MAG: hypothetical protein LBH98_05810 [Chitinispirillales bacterium]|jgi:hypothetical protein|nr:hypothetical protein [Chitinispirillales bacterium]